MSQPLNSHQAGLAFGGLLSALHLGWSLLVAFGLAQVLIDFVFQLHMIKPLYTIMPFSLTMMIGLIVMTFLSGYVMGYLLASLWNFLQSRVK